MNKESFLQHRKTKFRATLVKAIHTPFEDEVELSITKNGHQWTSVGLLPHEIKQIIKLLKTHEYVSKAT